MSNPCASLTFPTCDSGDVGTCIDAAVAAFMKQVPSVPGVVVSAQSDGETLFTRGYGAATIGGTAPTDCTSFQIDSLTKVFTAFSVLRLYEQGTIQNVTDPIGNYMSGLPDAWNPIQINQLLAMVSGIPDSGSATRPYKESLARVAKLPLGFTPGSQYEYSNSNFFLLGELVTTLAGDFMTYTRAQVLDAVDMPHTGLIPVDRATHPATPYENGSAVPWRRPACGYSGGGFATNMHELQRFAQGLANGVVLQPATYALMWTPYQLSDGSYGPFGLGWQVFDRPPGTLRAVTKNGGGYGWNTQLTYAPADAAAGTPALSACVLMNAAGCPMQLAGEIIHIVATSGVTV